MKTLVSPHRIDTNEINDNNTMLIKTIKETAEIKEDNQPIFIEDGYFT